MQVYLADIVGSAGKSDWNIQYLMLMVTQYIFILIQYFAFQIAPPLLNLAILGANTCCPEMTRQFQANPSVI
jgi:hypothetical protein